MSRKRKLPAREQVFIQSLLYHGFRPTTKRHNLKHKYGYVIPSSAREDADGIDVWVKMPRDHRIIPVQVAQRGTSLFRKYHKRAIHHAEEVEMVVAQAEFATQVVAFDLKRQRAINEKRQLCWISGIAFVLVQDYDKTVTHRRLAWGDIKALRYGVEHIRRWL
jgi:hypothetical protein